MTESAAAEALIGNLLAAGHSSNSILEQLETAGCSKEEAIEHLQRVYNTWAEDTIALNMQQTDLLAWHIEQRHILLQAVIVAGENKTVLSVLDSLAMLQGLAGAAETPKVPLICRMAEKEEKDGQQHSRDSSGDRDSPERTAPLAQQPDDGQTT